MVDETPVPGENPPVDEIPVPDCVLLTPGEVAALFRVDTKTVGRWAQAGRLPSVRTLGGHRRFHRDDVIAKLARSRP